MDVLPNLIQVALLHPFPKIYQIEIEKRNPEFITVIYDSPRRCNSTRRENLKQKSLDILLELNV